MTSVLDTFAAPWTPDASGLWAVGSTSSAARFGPDRLGMEIRASAGAAAAPTPSVERHFAPALDLRSFTELRLWIRSSRPGDGSPVQPIYLVVEATTDPPAGAAWSRLIPVRKANTWQLVVLWLGDMSPALRQAVGFLRLVSLDGRVAFEAAVDDLVATTPDPVAGADAALTARFDQVWTVDVAGVATAVPAVLDHPEAPAAPVLPSILITPWSVLPLGQTAAELDVADNPTLNGYHVRPSPASVELIYRVDVWADSRANKVFLLDRILADALEPLIVDDVAHLLEPVTPSAPERAQLVPPGRTPLFFRLVLPVETGVRSLRPPATPIVLVGDIHNRSDAEDIGL